MSRSGTLREVDWAKEWLARKRAQDKVKGFNDGTSFWESHQFVTRFSRMNTLDNREEIEGRLAPIDIRPGDKVLDIGAGPGTLAIPLAKRGCRVTAVEPSEAMRKAFLEHAIREEAPGITMVPHRWEDVTPAMLTPPYDVTIASFSLMMDDIIPEVLKMDQVTSRSVYLFWFLTHPPHTRVLRDLWPNIHGCEYEFGPTADVLWNALYQQGIYANLSVLSSRRHKPYPSLDDAVEDFTHRLHAGTPDHKEKIRGYLEEKLVPSGGGYDVPGDYRKAMIWWVK
ncbi:MAG: hypothetical protein A4E38_01016 [Methanoregulaceae archaeon PtaB.Bin108]|nr:MAG: hypothetical protein A4E38_01016 [Methanoregulaceae archaeon PtaB.Bin108]